jgi:hypothetical protein
MNLDTANITITVELPLVCLGHNISLDPVEVRGRVWSLSDRPMPDVIEWIAPDGFEGILAGSKDAFEKALQKHIEDALMVEAHTALNLDRLHQAFVDHHYEASLSERGDRLRVVAAE